LKSKQNKAQHNILISFFEANLLGRKKDRS